MLAVSADRYASNKKFMHRLCNVVQKAFRHLDRDISLNPSPNRISVLAFGH